MILFSRSQNSHRTSSHQMFMLRLGKTKEAGKNHRKSSHVSFFLNQEQTLFWHTIRLYSRLLAQNQVLQFLIISRMTRNICIWLSCLCNRGKDREKVGLHKDYYSITLACHTTQPRKFGAFKKHPCSRLLSFPGFPYVLSPVTSLIKPSSCGTQVYAGGFQRPQWLCCWGRSLGFKRPN